MSSLSKMYEYVCQGIYFIGNYIQRLIFVFSIYTLLICYGLFSELFTKKKKIIAKKYNEGDIYSGNLVHHFKNLKGLKNGVKFHFVSNINFNGMTNKRNNMPTFVFLHGIFESWYSWNSQLKMMDSMGIPCIAIDFKNHGNTSAHYAGSVSCELDLGKNFDLTHQGIEIAELLKELGIDNIVLVTTDLGTLICDKLVGEIYCPKIIGWIRCHEPMPAYPNDKGLPQKYLFWFNIKLSLMLMHFSNEMLLRIFYRATGWKSCESFSATYAALSSSETEACLENAICPFETGIYKGCNSNHMSWAGAYGYAFLNDIYTGAVRNIHSYELCDFPVWIVAGEFDKSCYLSYVDGSTSLGYKFLNGQFCTKMIRNDGEDGYTFFFGEEGREIKKLSAFSSDKYFVNSPDCRLIVHKNGGHMTHLETPDQFNATLKAFYDANVVPNFFTNNVKKL